MRQREQRMVLNREQFEARSGAPSSFSQFQLQQYLRASALRWVGRARTRAREGPEGHSNGGPRGPASWLTVAFGLHRVLRRRLLASLEMRARPADILLAGCGLEGSLHLLPLLRLAARPAPTPRLQAPGGASEDGSERGCLWGRGGEAYRGRGWAGVHPAEGPAARAGGRSPTHRSGHRSVAARVHDACLL